jgi:hypothetical protein
MGPSRKDQKLWTEEELAWVRSNASLVTAVEAAAHLRRTEKSTRHAGFRLGVKFKLVTNRSRDGKTVVIKPWTEKEEAELREYAKTMTKKEIASKLGRTCHSITLKLGALFIRARSEKPRWSKDEDQELMRLSEKYSPLTIAKKMTRSYPSIKERMISLGIKAFNGTYSAKAAAEYTGYAVSQLERARDAVGQTWKKQPHSWTKRYVITEEQLEELCEWLKNETWKKGRAA